VWTARCIPICIHLLIHLWGYENESIPGYMTGPIDINLKYFFGLVKQLQLGVHPSKMRKIFDRRNACMRGNLFEVQQSLWGIILPKNSKAHLLLILDVSIIPWLIFLSIPRIFQWGDILVNVFQKLDMSALERWDWNEGRFWAMILHKSVSSGRDDVPFASLFLNVRFHR